MNEIYPWLLPQWQQLMSLHQQQRMPHAILLTGSAGLGKTALAHALGHAVLCQQPLSAEQSSSGQVSGRACGHCASCRLLSAGTHPDYYRLKPLPPEKSKSKKPVLSIRIDAIRRLCNSLNQTSQMSGYRVAIIESAEMLNISAANSLLKTLEEPGEHTLIILVTSSPNRLPVTIRSRCQQLKIPVPAFPKVQQWLLENGTFDQLEQAEHAFKLAHDAPLAALEVSTQTEQRELLANALLARFNRENVLSYSLKLSQCDKQQVLGWMLDWVNDLIYLITPAQTVTGRLVNQANLKPLQQLAERADRKRLFELQSQLLQTLQQGSIALNEQLLWENLLLSWDNL